MATQTISLLGGNYNDVAAWVEAQVPTDADDVVAHTLGVSGGNLTVNVTSACRSADFTSYVSILAGTNSRIWNIGDAAGGSLKLVSGMTFSPAAGFRVTFASTTTGNQITSGSKTFTLVTFNGAGGSWLLQDDFSSLSTSLTNGTLDLNGHDMTCTALTISAGTKTLAMGSRTLTLTGTGTPWNNSNPTNFTLTGTGTIAITNTTAADKTFVGGGSTYYDLLITTGGTNPIIITGSNSFNKIRVTGGAAQAITFTAGTTQTFTGGSSAMPSGAASNLITLQSSAASAWTINTTVDISVDYVSISYCNVTGGGKLYCGTHSIDGGNNDANVIFTAPPVSSRPPGVSKMSIALGLGISL